jgi:hemerythrin
MGPAYNERIGEKDMTLEWTAALAVGLEEIDEQHRELFRRAGQLLEGLRAGETGEIAPLLDFLHEYAVVHFGAEESAMRAEGYPGYLRHKAEHDRFIGDLVALAEELDGRGPGAFLAVKASSWLSGWLRAHVSGTDAEMAGYLRGRRA